MTYLPHLEPLLVVAQRLRLERPRLTLPVEAFRLREPETEQSIASGNAEGGGAWMCEASTLRIDAWGYAEGGSTNGAARPFKPCRGRLLEEVVALAP
jgi:hypothetical protein|eukprot:578516-Prymnesium_polylepis.1